MSQPVVVGWSVWESFLQVATPKSLGYHRFPRRCRPTELLHRKKKFNDDAITLQQLRWDETFRRMSCPAFSSPHAMDIYGHFGGETGTASCPSLPNLPSPPEQDRSSFSPAQLTRTKQEEVKNVFFFIILYTWYGGWFINRALVGVMDIIDIIFWFKMHVQQVG